MMTCFFVNFVFKNDMFLLFLQIYDVIKNNYDNIFYTNCVFENIMFLLFFCEFVIIVINSFFFVNCVFENDILCTFYYIIFINPTIKFI